nr:MAG TPA: hypothetical protein [Crassvirales sp.]
MVCNIQRQEWIYRKQRRGLRPQRYRSSNRSKNHRGG